MRDKQILPFAECLSSLRESMKIEIEVHAVPDSWDKRHFCYNTARIFRRLFLRPAIRVFSEFLQNDIWREGKAKKFIIVNERPRSFDQSADKAL